MKARLPWLLLALWVALTALGMALSLARGDVLDALIAPALVVFAGVGALLAARRPENPIGWLLLTVALLIALSQVAQGLYTDEQSDPRPGVFPRTLVWADNWLFYVWMCLIGILVPLLFPNGRLPSPRWRWFARVSVAAVGVAVLGTAFGAATLEWGTDRTVPNPFRVPGPLGDALSVLNVIDAPLFMLVFLAALGGVVLRLRRATGIERLQLKWFAFAMVLLITGIVAAALGEVVRPIAMVGDIGWSLFLASLIVGLPAAIGIAVMRHRLYDIDLVINRALVYGALTVTLGAAYLAMVLLIGLAVGRSGFAVAASTLAVAGLFRPLRARIQEAVDRRFYRRRYDAARTLESFGSRLRDELDLEALGADLAGVVRETVQPAHVSLWLRSER